jgi:hypothetical protein
MNRRTFLQASIAASAVLPHVSFASDAASAADQAHAEIWRRFIDKYGIMIDFADMDGKVSLPTPEELRDGKPNALGWWAPIENGAMFNGLYMDAAILRWKRTKSADDATKARKLMVYYTTRERQMIREELYAPIAAVLAFVLSLRRGETPGAPMVDVPVELRFDAEGRPETTLSKNSASRP